MYFDNTIKEEIAFPIIDTLIDRDDTRYRDKVIKKYISNKNIKLVIFKYKNKLYRRRNY